MIPVGCLGQKLYPGTDQFLRLDSGHGRFVMGLAEDQLDFAQEVTARVVHPDPRRHLARRRQIRSRATTREWRLHQQGDRGKLREHLEGARSTEAARALPGRLARRGTGGRDCEGRRGSQDAVGLSVAAGRRDEFGLGVAATRERPNSMNSDRARDTDSKGGKQEMNTRVNQVRSRRRRERRRLRDAALVRRCREERNRLEAEACGKALPA